MVVIFCFALQRYCFFLIYANKNVAFLRTGLSKMKF